MSSSPPLNPAQRQAVHHIDTPLLVLAGAGSGKTRVITHKIAWLIRQCGLSPSHIAALTFTNKAAREMKARVSSLLDKGEGRGLRISTFHTLGLDIIRRERQTLGYREGFSIFDTQDGESLIKELLHRDGEQGDMAKEMLWQISSWKNRTLTPEAVAASGEHPPVARLYSKYNQHLKAYNAVDFDDLIMLPLQLFRHHREALERWQNRIRYLLVDEYQDTNEAQYELVRLLTGVRCALTVVGDDDQSIYTWRGARPENLAQLQQDYPSLEVIKLEQNYRSMGRILKVANQLIDNNPHLFPKRLWSERGYGDPILVITAADEEDEALKVVSRIIHLQFQQGCKPGECAILYRGNYQSRPFEKALREHRIPYQISGGTSFFAHSEVKDIISYLRLLNNPDDDAAFLRVVNTPRREIGAATLEKLGHYATSRGISLFAAAFELGLKQTLSERAYERLNQFVHWLVDIADRARRGDPVAAVRDLIKETDYLSWLNDSVDAAKTIERKTANIEELIAWIARMAAEWEDESVTLADLVGRLALFDILERQNEDEGHEAVRLMTLHAAKGLEFPHLFLVGMEEELLPHRTSIEEDNIAEERRLAYVGITRAQITLTITLASRRRRGGETIRCEPSRFLQELPQDDLQWEGRDGDISPEEKQTRGRAHLANIRSLLK